MLFENKVAVIEGVNKLSPANCKCTDLRGGAALVVAALGANGQSKIDEIHHILRGYDDIVATLNSINADTWELNSSGILTTLSCSSLTKSEVNPSNPLPLNLEL